MGHHGGDESAAYSEEKTEPFSQSEIDARLKSYQIEEVNSGTQTATVPLDTLLVPPDKGIRILVRPLTRSRSVSPGNHDNCEWLALRAEVAASNQPQQKVLAVTQTSRDIKFSVRIPGERLDDDSPRPPLWCELYYDPTSDNQILLNRSDVPITLVSTSSSLPLARPGVEYVVNPGTTKGLSPGTWRIKVRDVDVLDFRILEKRPVTPHMPSRSTSDSSLSEAVNSSGKRSFSGEEDEFSPEKRLRAVGATKKSNDDGVIMFLPARADPLIFPLPTEAKGKEVAASTGHALLDMQQDETLEIPGGCELDEYRITKKDPIAATSLSSVFKGEHSGVPGGTITVKVLKTRAPATANGAVAKPQDNERNVIRQADIWLREFHSQEDLEHDSIVRLWGGDARYLSLYMEHVDARDVAAKGVWRSTLDYFTGTRLDATRIIRDIAGALHYIHGRGLVHNDIKPSNILYSSERGAVLCDFGLSTQMKNAASTGGTPYYMPPEFIGQKLRGPPSDVWALGVTMLYILRKIPFPESRGRQTHPKPLHWQIAHLNNPPPAAHHGGASGAGARGGLSAVAQMQIWLSEIHGAREDLKSNEKLERLVSEMLVPNPNQRITIRKVVGELFSEGLGKAQGK